MEVWPLPSGIPLNSPESVPRSLQGYKAPQVVKCNSWCIFPLETAYTGRGQQSNSETHTTHAHVADCPGASFFCFILWLVL